MDITATAYTIIDRIAHQSTTDQDIVNSAYGLRRICRDEVPSELLQPMSRSHRDKLSKLNHLVARLQAEIVALECTNQNLLGIQSGMKQQIRQLEATSPRPSRDCSEGYSYDEVMGIIRDKFGKQNGGLTLWADHNATLHAVDPNVARLTPSILQTWRRADSYPSWAVDQLLAMPVSRRVAHKWSPEDIDYLMTLHLADPRKSDDQLATECSSMFGCEINSNSIKSKFNTLRKEGRIPAMRSR